MQTSLEPLSFLYNFHSLAEADLITKFRELFIPKASESPTYFASEAQWSEHAR